MDRDALKREAAEQAAAMVEDGMVVGLGTGSTAAFFIESLIARAQRGLSDRLYPHLEGAPVPRRRVPAGLRLVGIRTPTPGSTSDDRWPRPMRSSATAWIW